MNHKHCQRLRIGIAIGSFIWAAVSAPVAAQSLPDGLIEVMKGKRTYHGRALAADAKTLVLLQRDGRMKLLPADEISIKEIAATTFKPFSFETIRAKLQEEFGDNYQISTTQHYVIAHPRGEHNVWGQPFEILFGRFKQYFENKGIRLEDPPFPMIAVVLKTRREFDMFLANYQPELVSPQIVGYYSPLSNRMITYAQGNTLSRQTNGILGNATVVHEAVHQAAFNTGVHSRIQPTPRWFSEGLATMFEAPGIHSNTSFPRPGDRVHFEQLAFIKHFAETKQPLGSLSELVAGDELFRHDPARAYAFSWGLTYFLAETAPFDYAKYIRRIGDRAEFQDYGGNQRIEDFVRVFGMQTDELELRMMQFLVKLK